MAHWSRRQVCVALGAMPAVSVWADVSSSSTAPIVAEALRVRAGRPRSLRVLVPRGSEANVRPVARAFEEQTGIKIKLESTPVADINTRLLLAHGLGESFDVALPATYGLPDLVEAGALSPLDEHYAALSRASSSASVYALGDVVDGRIYGLQTDGDVYVMFYNRGLLEDPALVSAFKARYGSAPAPARTFEALDRLMQFYHAPDQGRFGGALFRAPGYLAWEYWMRLHALGRLPFDGDMRPQLTSSAGVRALRELVAASRWLHPDTATAGLTDNWKLFAEGRTLCNIGWGGSQKYFRAHAEALDGGVLVAPTPGGRIAGRAVDMGFFNWGWNYAVPTHAAESALATLFACFAVQPDVSTQAVRAADGFFDPFQSAHFDDAEVETVYGRNFLDVQAATLRRAIPDLYLPGRSRYMDSLDDYIHRANRGELRPVDALGAVENLWERHTDALGRRNQVAAWRGLRRRYPAALRSVLS